jgi:hypothetical protein
MSREALGTYLNDHLSGSVVAVETLERLIHADHPNLSPDTLRTLLAEIREDQRLLQTLLERLDVGEHPVKKAAAWLTEKVGRIKLDDGPLGTMEMLEALALGITGKLKLWLTLERVAPRHPELGQLDYARLQSRAREQHELVEDLRLKEALRAL